MIFEILKLIGIVVLLAIGIYGPYIFLMSFGPLTGIGPWRLPSDLIWVIFPALIIFLIGFFSIFFLFSHHRQGAVHVLVLCLSLLVLFMPCVFIAKTLRAEGFRLAMLRAEPLVDAIEQYKKDKGVPPKSLNNLSPEYLDSMPKGLPPLEIMVTHDTVWWLAMDRNNCKAGKGWNAFVMGIDKCSFLKQENYMQEIKKIWFAKPVKP